MAAVDTNDVSVFHKRREKDAKMDGVERRRQARFLHVLYAKHECQSKTNYIPQKVHKFKKKIFRWRIKYNNFFLLNDIEKVALTVSSKNKEKKFQVATNQNLMSCFLVFKHGESACWIIDSHENN